MAVKIPGSRYGNDNFAHLSPQFTLLRNRGIEEKPLAIFVLVVHSSLLMLNPFVDEWSVPPSWLAGWLPDCYGMRWTRAGHNLQLAAPKKAATNMQNMTQLLLATPQRASRMQALEKRI